MTRFLAALMVCLGLALPAQGQTVPVRSGEHEGFTRLALYLPERLTWRREATEQGATLVFDREGLSFDTASVFDRLSGARLSALSASPDGSKLNLSLGCACKIQSFWHDRSILVVDIIGEADLPTRPRQRLQAPTGQTEAAPQDAPSAVFPLGPLASARPSTAASLMDGPPGDTPPAAATSLPGSKESAERLAGKETQHDADTLREMQNRLVTQLGRAATQGLLSPRDGPALRPVAPEPEAAHEDDNPDLEEAGPALLPAKTGPSANINLKAESSIDRDFLRHLTRQTNTLDGAACIPDPQLDIGAWGEERPFHGQIGSLRKRLVGEFDRIDNETAIQLTRLYLYFGFGAEARQMLNMLTAPMPHTDILSDMARIIEDGEALPGSVLAGQLECETPAALWSALATLALPKNTPIETDAILRAFNGLPKHLRDHLGPGLSRRFLQAGRNETAKEILRIIDRGDQTAPPKTNFVRAEIEIATGATDAAEATLDEVVESNAEPSAEAVLRKIETRLATGHAVSFELAQLAGAYAVENRNQPIGQDLNRAYLRALAASGAFDQSYAELERLTPDLTAPGLRALRNDLLALLAENADQLTFLRHTLARHGGNPAELDPEVANTTARRLLDAGFDTSAASFVAETTDGAARRARRLIRAEIALVQDRPRLAEVELLGLTGTDVNAVRAMARSRLGEHNAAYALYQASDAPAEAKREAWLAEDWQALQQADDPVIGDVAELLANEDRAEAANPEPPGVLARNRALLEDSSQTREVLRTLLEAKSVPASFDGDG